MIDLFSIPIYITKVPNHEHIKTVVSNNIEQQGTPKTWNCSVNSSFGTSYFWLCDLLDNYNFLYDEFFYKLKCKVDISITDAWYNDYSVGDFQEQHHHLPADFSCIHYVQLNSKHQGTTFVNPNRLLNSNNKVLKHIYPETFTPYVTEGDVIIFPSYMEHFVKKQQIEDRRITLSWNLKIKSLIPLDTDPNLCHTT